MRIAQIAPLAETVPPAKYGGTERVIYNLTEELVRLGHDVTLFASGDSKTSAKLVSVFPKALRYANIKDLYGFNTHSLMNMGLAYSMQDQFDVIHDHNPHISLPTSNLATTPVITTWHGPFTEEIISLFSILSKPYMVSISESQARPAPHLNFIGTVYNGLAMEHYPFSATDDGYLLFVGRISVEKGVHIAMDVAVALNMPLIIAAKLDNVAHDLDYYRRYIRPRLKRHPDLLKWVGEVDEAERNRLMSKARAFLHAVTWPEPFGLTLIESMSCGCPVVAFKQGSIPEIIIDGKTGYVVENFKQMVAAVRDIGRISRADCRVHSLTNFSAKKMAQGYLQMYQKAINLSKKPMVVANRFENVTTPYFMPLIKTPRLKKPESVVYNQRIVASMSLELDK